MYGKSSEQKVHLSERMPMSSEQSMHHDEHVPMCAEQRMQHKAGPTASPDKEKGFGWL